MVLPEGSVHEKIAFCLTFCAFWPFFRTPAVNCFSCCCCRCCCFVCLSRRTPKLVKESIGPFWWNHCIPRPSPVSQWLSFLKTSAEVATAHPIAKLYIPSWFHHFPFTSFFCLQLWRASGLDVKHWRLRRRLRLLAAIKNETMHWHRLFLSVFLLSLTKQLESRWVLSRS